MKNIVIDTNGMDFERYLETVGEAESASLLRPIDFGTKFLTEDDQMSGDLLCWSKTQGSVCLGEGQLSVWSGVSGHGKSELVGQVMSWLMMNHTVCIASMEMKPHETLLRMCRQTCGVAVPSREMKLAWLEWATPRLWIYDRLDTVSVDSVLGMAHYASHELGCQHIVIDSLTKCGIGRGADALDRQVRFVDSLQNCAKRWGCHIHLIAHMRKGEDELKPCGKHDLRGAAELADLSDNVFIVHRNKLKEKKVEEGDDSAQHWPDCLLIHAKNRHFGVERSYPLHRQACGQFTELRGKVMIHPAKIQPVLEV